MFGSVERRRHERVATGVPVAFESMQLSRAERRHLAGLATSATLRGLFVATNEPPRRGEVLSLWIYLDDGDDAPPVRATAVVRWRRRFEEPRGVGIEFICFESTGERRFESWLAAQPSSPGAAAGGLVAGGATLPAAGSQATL